MSRIIIVFLILLSITSCSDTNRTNDAKIVQKKILSNIIEKGKTGDIVLKNGYGLVSKAIVKLLDERIPISHCGILMKDDKSNSFYIIHSVAKQVSDRDGVQKISLKKFINDVNPKDFYLLRYKENEKDFISREAKCYLSNKTPFDHKYDLYSNEELYCSEFIYKIFFSEKGIDSFIPRNKRGGRVLHFNEILDSEYFETIISYI